MHVKTRTTRNFTLVHHRKQRKQCRDHKKKHEVRLIHLLVLLGVKSQTEDPHTLARPLKDPRAPKQVDHAPQHRLQRKRDAAPSDNKCKAAKTPTTQHPQLTLRITSRTNGRARVQNDTEATTPPPHRRRRRHHFASHHTKTQVARSNGPLPSCSSRCCAAKTLHITVEDKNFSVGSKRAMPPVAATRQSAQSWKPLNEKKMLPRPPPLESCSSAEPQTSAPSLELSNGQAPRDARR